MPQYVRRGGLDVSPPPWECPKVEATVFYVPADAVNLQQVVDRTLNAPSQGRLNFRSTLPWVALTFQKFHNMRSLSGHSWQAETHSYNEAAFWVLVEEAAGYELLIPYMFVEDWVMVAAGREIYGYPKELAAVTLPPRTQPALYEVRGLSAQTGSAAAPKPIVQCAATAASATRIVLSNMSRDFATLIGPKGFLNELEELIQLMLGGQLPTVFLRQLRALAGGPDADAQQVTAATANLLSFAFPAWELPWLLWDYELRLGTDPSHPICTDFGFAVQQNGSIAVPVGFQCDISMRLDPGRPR